MSFIKGRIRFDKHVGDILTYEGNWINNVILNQAKMVLTRGIGRPTHVQLGGSSDPIPQATDTGLVAPIGFDAGITAAPALNTIFETDGITRVFTFPFRLAPGGGRNTSFNINEAGLLLNFISDENASHNILATRVRTDASIPLQPDETLTVYYELTMKSKYGVHHNVLEDVEQADTTTKSFTVDTYYNDRLSVLTTGSTSDCLRTIAGFGYWAWGNSAIHSNARMNFGLYNKPTGSGFGWHNTSFQLAAANMQWQLQVADYTTNPNNRPSAVQIPPNSGNYYSEFRVRLPRQAMVNFAGLSDTIKNNAKFILWSPNEHSNPFYTVFNDDVPGPSLTWSTDFDLVYTQQASVTF